MKTFIIVILALLVGFIFGSIKKKADYKFMEYDQIMSICRQLNQNK